MNVTNLTVEHSLRLIVHKNAHGYRVTIRHKLTDREVSEEGANFYPTLMQACIQLPRLFTDWQATITNPI